MYTVEEGGGLGKSSDEGGAPFRAGSRLARTAGRASRAPCTAGSLCSFIANKVELSQK